MPTRRSGYLRTRYPIPRTNRSSTRTGSGIASSSIVRAVAFQGKSRAAEEVWKSGEPVLQRRGEAAIYTARKSEDGRRNPRGDLAATCYQARKRTDLCRPNWSPPAGKHRRRVTGRPGRARGWAQFPSASLVLGRTFARAAFMSPAYPRDVGTLQNQCRTNPAVTEPCPPRARPIRSSCPLSTPLPVSPTRP